MGHEERVAEIERCLAIIKQRVQWQDVPKAEIEALVRDLLQVVTGAGCLKRLEEEERNYPGVDLGEEAEGWAVQVTKRADKRKIEKTLRRCEENGIDEKYQRIIMFQTAETKLNYTRGTAPKRSFEGPQGRLRVKCPEDLWDWRTVLEYARDNMGEAERIHEILIRYTGSLKGRKIVGVTMVVAKTDYTRIVRREKEKELIERIRSNKIVWIEGEAGSGKTTLLNSALASGIAKEAVFYNLKGVVPGKMAEAIEEAGDRDEDVVVMEDMGWNERAQNQPLLHASLERRRGKGKLTLVTCEEAGAGRAGLPGREAAVVEVGSLSRGEVTELVTKAGGRAELAEFVYRLSGGGHTELASVYVETLRKQDWSEGGITEAMTGWGSDVERSRREVACRIVREGSAWDKKLIAKLAVGVGTFSEKTAQAVTGCCARALEPLKGYWMKRVEGSRWRMSPLLRGFADGELEAEGVERAHQAWGFETARASGDGEINIDATLIHAIAGKSEAILCWLCITLLGDGINPGQLREGSFLIQCQLTLEGHKWITEVGKTLLLLVQLKAAEGNSAQTKDLDRRMGEEIEKIGNKALRAHLKALRGAIVLRRTESVEELERVWEAAAAVGEVVECIEKEGSKTWTGERVRHGMFAKAFAESRTVERLQAGIRQMGRLSKIERRKLLEFGAGQEEWLSVGVSRPWVDGLAKGKTPTELVADYRKVLAEAQALGEETVEAEVRAVISVLWNEYLKDWREAEKVLEMRATSRRARNTIHIARAKVAAWNGDRNEADKRWERVNAMKETLSPLARVMFQRAAGINAHEAGMHERSAQWFGAAAQSASEVTEADRAVDETGGTQKRGAGRNEWWAGLETDKTIQLALGGREEEARETALRLVDKVEKTGLVLAGVGLQARNLIPHVCLWLKERAEGSRNDGNEARFGIYGGMASNPEPAKELADRKVASWQNTWAAARYQLALAEIVGRREKVERPISAEVSKSITCIPGMELLMAYELKNAALVEGDGIEALNQLRREIGLHKMIIGNIRREEEVFGGIRDRSVTEWEITKAEVPQGRYAELLLVLATRATLADPAEPRREGVGRLYSAVKTEIGQLEYMERWLSGGRAGTPDGSSEGRFIRILEAIGRDERCGANWSPQERWQYICNIWWFFSRCQSWGVIEELLLGWMQSMGQRDREEAGKVARRISFLQELEKNGKRLRLLTPEQVAAIEGSRQQLQMKYPLGEPRENG